MNSIFDIKRIIKAFGYSIEGIKSAAKSEAAFRQELIAAVIMIPLAFMLNETLAIKLILVFTIFIVLIAELINTAIEAVVNRISEELHPLSKKAKDVGSAIVLVSLINAAVIWGAVLFF